MQDKLQQITQKLYREGLSKGRSDADELVAHAREEAWNIVNEARVKAESILAEAHRGAEDLRKNTETEVVLAARQTLAVLKDDIRNLVTAKELTPRIKEAADDPAFLQELILTVARNWNGTGQPKTDLDIFLPEDTQEKIVNDLRAALEKALDGGMTVGVDGRVRSGFRVAPKDGGYYIGFTDEDLDALLQEFLRPKVAELLFGTK